MYCKSSSRIIMSVSVHKLKFMYPQSVSRAGRVGQGVALLAGFVITFHHLHLPTRPLNGSYPLIKIFYSDTNLSWFPYHFKDYEHLLDIMKVVFLSSGN